MLNLTGTKSRRALVCCAILIGACESSSASAPPPPPPPLPIPAAPAAPALDVPAAPVAEAPVAAPEVTPTPSEAAPPVTDDKPADAKPANSKAKAGASLYDREPDRKVKAPEPTAKPLPTPTIKVDVSKLAGQTLPVPKPDAKEEPAKASFAMPGSAHVTINAPKGLEADLAKDTRMRPWLEKGVAAATTCYQREAKTQPNLKGTIEVAIVMRENDRPDASIKTLPPQLSGLFACLTGAMMKSRMPLFTGKEGQKYTARVTFKP